MVATHRVQEGSQSPTATLVGQDRFSLVLDGVYRHTDVEPIYVEVPASSDEALRALLHKIIARLMQEARDRAVHDQQHRCHQLRLCGQQQAHRDGQLRISAHRGRCFSVIVDEGVARK